MSEKLKSINDKLNPIRNRWIVVIGAILVQLALGTIYSWSTITLFATPYLKFFDAMVTKEATTFIFAFGLVSFAVTMIFAGKLQQKYGPKLIAIIGGILLAIGVIASAAMTTFIGMLITYGIIFGCGIGFAYVCPIACASKWFPDKKGFINGIAVAGFGMGSFIFNYLIKFLANPTNIDVDVAPLAFQQTVLLNVPIMFIVIGIIYLVMVVVGALTLINPPEGWKPEGWNPPPASVEDGISGLDFTRGQMIKLPQFWMLWLAFVFSAICGLMTIGAYSSFAKDLPPGIINAEFFLTTVGALAAMFNGAGRIVWGALADKINYKRTMMVMFLTQGILILIFFATGLNEILFLIFVCLLYFCFGGNFSLFPSATADLFGNKNLGPNYGIVFTAYGIAGFLGATLVLLFAGFEVYGYLILFIIMGLMSFGAMVIAYILKPPTKER
ncbi:MAG: OFA family MFS transporter [Promethearchaeota archaeon]